MEVIHGWLMAEHDPRVDSLRSLVRPNRRLVVFFHENAGNLGLRLDYFSTLYHKNDCDILAIAYRGYSSSSGIPSEEGLKLDAEAVMEFVDRDLVDFYKNNGGVFVVGRSLGGAVAAAVVSRLPEDKLAKIDGLVLENTFTSIPDMADQLFSVLAYFKGMVLTNYWQTIDLVPHIELPILYVTGDKDEIVPTEHTHRLQQASVKARHTSTWVNKGGSHNDTWFSKQKEYLEALDKFMTDQHQQSDKLRRPSKYNDGTDTVKRVRKFSVIEEPRKPDSDSATIAEEQKDSSDVEL